MELPTIGTVGFIVALTAFFDTQFKLKGNKALAAAFFIALVFGFAPLVSEALPTFAPFIDVLLNTIVLTIAASGGYDIAVKIATKISGVRTTTY